MTVPQLSALIRIPLNVFVLVALLTGVASARHAVLVVCAMSVGDRPGGRSRSYSSAHCAGCFRSLRDPSILPLRFVVIQHDYQTGLLAIISMIT